MLLSDGEGVDAVVFLLMGRFLFLAMGRFFVEGVVQLSYLTVALLSLGRFSLNSELNRSNLNLYSVQQFRCAFLMFQRLRLYTSDLCKKNLKGTRKGYFMPLTLEEQTFVFYGFSWGARNSE